MTISKDLVAASSTPLVLSILSTGESYGYALIKKVRELSDGELEWTDGMLYPVLHRMEREGLIQAQWKKSETGRKRKYYTIKKSGSKVLEEQRTQWLKVFSTLQKTWEVKPCST